MKANKVEFQSIFRCGCRPTPDEISKALRNLENIKQDHLGRLIFGEPIKYPEEVKTDAIEAQLRREGYCGP